MNKIGFVRGRKVFLGAAGLLMVSVALVHAASRVPYHDSFGYDEGTPLDGVHGWAATGNGSALVSGGRVALQDIQLSNAFEPNENAVTITIDIEPQFTATPPSVPDSRFKFYVNTNGLVTAYDGASQTNLTHTPLVEGESVRFLVKVDYPLQVWSLSVDGVEVAANLALAGGTEFSTFEDLGFVEGGTNSFAYVDSVTIQRAQTASTFVLPFRETFDTLSPGDLDGQRDWLGADAVVQSAVTRGGNACAITSRTAQIQHTFIGGHTNVWTQFHIRPLRGVAPRPPVGSTFAFHVNSNGVVVAYDGTSPTELTGTYVPPDAWVRFSTFSDYANTNWDLYLGSSLIAEDFRFYDTNVTAFTTFGVMGADGDIDAYVDSLYIGETRAPAGSTVFVVR